MIEIERKQSLRRIRDELRHTIDALRQHANRNVFSIEIAIEHITRAIDEIDAELDDQ